jgi:hypothetical protein
MKGAPRPSLDTWVHALVEAREAQETLSHCDKSSLELWEITAQRGLRFLEMRYRYSDLTRQLSNWAVLVFHAYPRLGP